MANDSSDGDENRRTAGAGSVGIVASVGGITLRDFGTRWMEERKLSGEEELRAIKADRSRWFTRIEQSPLFDLPISTISPLTVADWLRVQRK